MNLKLKTYTTEELEKELMNRKSLLRFYSTETIEKEIRERKYLNCRNISIFDIAAYFLKLEPNISKKKLNFLCYYSYAWYYTLYNKKLFPEKFEAWVHGPVCPELWLGYDNFIKNLKFE